MNTEAFLTCLVIFIAYCIIGFIFEFFKALLAAKMQQKAIKEKSDQIYLILIEKIKDLKERCKK